MEPIAGVSKQFRTVVISYSAEGKTSVEGTFYLQHYVHSFGLGANKFKTQILKKEVWQNFFFNDLPFLRFNFEG